MSRQQSNFDGMLAHEVFPRHQLKIEEARQRIRLLTQEQQAFQSYLATHRERKTFGNFVLSVHEAKHDPMIHLRAIDNRYATFERKATEADHQISWSLSLSAQHVPFLTKDMSDLIEADQCPYDNEANAEHEESPLHSKLSVACYEKDDPFATGADPDLCAPLHPSSSLSHQIAFLHRYVENRSGSPSPAPSSSAFDGDSSSDEASEDDDDDDDEQVALAMRRSATAKLRAATARRTVAALRTKPVVGQVAFVGMAAQRVVDETRDLRTEWKRYETKAVRKGEGRVMAQSDLAMDHLMGEEEMLGTPLTPLPTPGLDGRQRASWNGEVSSRNRVGIADGDGREPAREHGETAETLVEVEAEAPEVPGHDCPTPEAKDQDEGEAVAVSDNDEDEYSI